MDVNLQWNASEFGNITLVQIPPHRIWKPDIHLMNEYALYLSSKVLRIMRMFQFTLEDPVIWIILSRQPPLSIMRAWLDIIHTGSSTLFAI